jgi:hypothetical protein
VDGEDAAPVALLEQRPEGRPTEPPPPMPRADEEVVDEAIQTA